MRNYNVNPVRDKNGKVVYAWANLSNLVRELDNDVRSLYNHIKVYNPYYEECSKKEYYELNLHQYKVLTEDTTLYFEDRKLKLPAGYWIVKVKKEEGLEDNEYSNAAYNLNSYLLLSHASMDFYIYSWDSKSGLVAVKSRDIYNQYVYGVDFILVNHPVRFFITDEGKKLWTFDQSDIDAVVPSGEFDSKRKVSKSYIINGLGRRWLNDSPVIGQIECKDTFEEIFCDVTFNQEQRMNSDKLVWAVHARIPKSEKSGNQYSFLKETTINLI